MSDYSLFAVGSGDEIQVGKESHSAEPATKENVESKVESLADTDPLFGANSGDDF